MRKPRGKASRESHRSLDPHDGKRDPAATAREESTRAMPFSLAFFKLLTGGGASLWTPGDPGEGSHAGQDKERRHLGLNFHTASY